jgi:hypothetical protein
VLHYRGERHPEGCCELTDGRWFARQALEHVPARGVGQRMKNAVERMIKHVLYYRAP